MGQFLNSFGFTLLILKFVQSLPDQSLVQYKGSVANLVVDFFMFYTYKFNLYQYSVAVHDPSKLCRGKYQVFEQRHSAWPMMEVLDPVNPLNNVAQNVGIHQYDRMGAEVKRSCFILQQASMGRMPANQSIFQLLTEPIAYSVSYNRSPQYITYNVPVNTVNAVTTSTETAADELEGATMTQSDSENSRLEGEGETDSVDGQSMDSEDSHSDSADDPSAETESESHQSMAYTVNNDGIDSSVEEADLDIESVERADGDVMDSQN